MTSAHPVISLAADPLAAALTDPDLQELAWSGHGFRGKLGGVGRGGPVVEVCPRDGAAAFVRRTSVRLTYGSGSLRLGMNQTRPSLVPMPDAATLLALPRRLSRPGRTPAPY